MQRVLEGRQGRTGKGSRLLARAQTFEMLCDAVGWSILPPADSPHASAPCTTPDCLCAVFSFISPCGENLILWIQRLWYLLDSFTIICMHTPAFPCFSVLSNTQTGKILDSLHWFSSAVRTDEAVTGTPSCSSQTDNVQLIKFRHKQQITSNIRVQPQAVVSRINLCIQLLIKNCRATKKKDYLLWVKHAEKWKTSFVFDELNTFGLQSWNCISERYYTWIYSTDVSLAYSPNYIQANWKMGTSTCAAWDMMFQDDISFLHFSSVFTTWRKMSALMQGSTKPTLADSRVAVNVQSEVRVFCSVCTLV